MAALVTLRNVAYGLTALRRSRIDARATSSLPIVVLPIDIDLFMHVTNARYLTYMDLGRVDLLTRTGILRASVRLRAPMLVGGIDIQFRRPLLPFERFTLESQLVAWDEKWFFWEHRFVASGLLAARSLARMTFRQQGASMTPAKLLEAAHQDPSSPPVPDHLQD